MLQRSRAWWLTTLATILVAAVLGSVPPPVALATVSTFTFTETIPYSTVLEACGDIISIDGEIHHVAHITSSDRGQLVVKEIFNPSGLTGISLLSGATYHAVGVTTFGYTVNFVINAGETTTTVNNFKMISDGSTANFLVHQTYHVTWNPNGGIAFIDKVSVACRG